MPRDSLHSKKKRVWRPFRCFHRKYFQKSFLPFVKVKNSEEHNVFSFKFFSQFLSFLVIFLFLHFSFFFFFFNGARKHQTPWRLCWLLLNADALGFLFIFFLSFTLHATLRHPQLHVGQGKWKATKNENKTQKRMGNLFWGGRRLWSNTTTTQRVVHVEHILGRHGRFNCVFHFETTFFRGLIFHSPVDKHKMKWYLSPFILKVIAAVARGTNWPLRKMDEEEDEQVVEHASPISKCV